MAHTTKTLTVSACKALRFELPAYVSRRKFIQRVLGLRSPCNYVPTSASKAPTHPQVVKNSEKIISAIRRINWSDIDEYNDETP